MVRSWEGNLRQLPPPVLTYLPIFSHLLLTSRRGCDTEFRRQRHFACRLTSGTNSHISVLQGATHTDYRNLKSPQKMFRLLILKRRGKHPQISCCKGICFLQSPNKVFTSLLYTPEKTGPSFFEFSLPNLCKRGFIQVRSWMQLKWERRRKGRSTLQLRSYTG